MTASSNHTRPHASMTSASSFHPTEGRNVTVSNKNLKPEKKAKQKGKEKAVPHVPAMFLGNISTKSSSGEPSGLSQLKSSANKDMLDDETNNETDDECSLKDGDDETMVVANLTSLVDIKNESKSKKIGGGRPANALIDDLVQKCYHISHPEKHLHQCISSCGTTYASRNLSRIVRHAIGCRSLPAELRKQAKAHAANNAPS